MGIIKPPFIASVNSGKLLSRGVIGAWPMTEGSDQSNVYDVSGYFSDGSPVNAPPWQGSPWGWSTGYAAGSSQAHDFGPSPWYRESSIEMSIGFLAEVNSDDFNGTVRSMFDTSGTNPSSTGGFYILQDDRGGSNPVNGLKIQLKNALGFIEVKISNIFTSTSIWYCIVLTYSLTDGLSLYVNGDLKGNTAANGDFSPKNANFFAGTSNTGGLPATFKVQNVICWDRAISKSEASEFTIDPFSIYRDDSDSRFTLPVIPVNIPTQTIHYAIDIDISDNTSGIEEQAIGLFGDSLLNGGAGGSAFRWITERPDYDGATVVPTGELPTANATKWGEGLIISRSALGAPIRMININVAGNYGSLSGFQFSLDNVEIESGTFDGQMLFDILDDENFYLVNRKVRFYAVMDDVFYNLWSGVVSETSHTELKFNIVCEDDFKTIHKVIPPQIANEALFPNIIKKSIGKTIPVTFGDVSHALTVNIQAKKEPVALVTSNFVPNQPSRSSSVGVIVSKNPLTDGNGNPVNTSFFFLTGSKVYVEDELNGKFFRLVNEGGGDSYYKITKSFSSTVFSDSPAQDQRVQISTDSIIDLTGIVIFDPAINNTFGTSEKCTWIEVFDFESIYIVSNRPVFELPVSDSGPVAELTFFDSNTAEFIEVSEALELKDKTDINFIGFPGFLGFSDSLANNGDFEKIIVLKPRSVTSRGTLGAGNVIFSDYPASGESVPKLVDGDRNTKYTHTVDVLGAIIIANDGIRFTVELPKDLSVADYEALFVAVDYDFTNESDSDGDYNVIRPSAVPFGVHSFSAGFIKIESFLLTSTLAAVPREVRLVPPAQYEEQGDPPSTLINFFEKIDLKEFYSTRHELKAYPYLFSDVFFGNNFGLSAGESEEVSIDVYQIALCGVKKINVTNNDIYIKAKGEFSSNSASETNSVYHIFESMLIDYDIIPASEIDLTDTETHLNWVAGRQLLERKSSFTYLKELAQQSFTALFPSRIGKRKLVSFRQGEIASTLFSNSNGTIIKNSISKFGLSPITDVYNEFDIQYEFLEAADRFDKSVFIKNVDQDTFPTQFQSTGSDNTYTAWTQIEATAQPGSPDYEVPFTGTISGGTLPTAVVGNAISLNDPSGWGDIIYGRVVSVTVTEIVFNFNNATGIVSGAITTTGTIHIHGTSVQKWTTFVGGYSNFNKASELWNVCHNSFIRNKVVRRLPDTYSHCKYFIDETNFGGSPGDNSTAHKYIELLVEWTSRQKEIAEFQVPATVANIQRELMEFVQFSDIKYTAGELREGYITKIKPIPGADTIVLELTLIPADIESVSSCEINETGLSSDDIDETGSQPEDINETGLC